MAPTLSRRWRVPEILPISSEFAERLRALRKTRKYTAERTASGITRCGYRIERHTIAAIEAKAVKTVSIDLVVATAQFFGTTVNGLFTGPMCGVCSDDPPPGFTCDICKKSGTAKNMGSQ
jgi:transcriptional regulator with XRE-family HTH domain